MGGTLARATDTPALGPRATWHVDPKAAVPSLPLIDPKVVTETEAEAGAGAGAEIEAGAGAGVFACSQFVRLIR